MFSLGYCVGSSGCLSTCGSCVEVECQSYATSGQPSGFPTSLPTISPLTSVPVLSESLVATTTGQNHENGGGFTIDDLTMTEWIAISAGLFIFVGCIIVIILTSLRSKNQKPINQAPDTVHVPAAVKGDANELNVNEFEREIEGLDSGNAIARATLKVDVVYQRDNKNEKVRIINRKTAEKEDDSLQLVDNDDDSEAMYQNEGGNNIISNDGTKTSTGNTTRKTMHKNTSDTTAKSYQVTNDGNTRFDVIDTMQNLKTSNVK